ncbi:MAG: YncE family protein [Bacteroidia bacterium]|nr:YncE family protein [Bacteroidia bacterium]
MKTRQLLLFLFVIALAAPRCRKHNCKKEIIEKVYVANEMSGTVTIFDADDLEVLKTVDLDDKDEMFMPHNVQVAPDQRSVWISAPNMHHGEGDDRVVVLKGKRDRDAHRISIGTEQHPAHVLVDDASTYAYITATEPGQVIMMDAQKYKVIKRIDIGSGSEPHGMRYMNGKLYVACMGSQSIAVVEPESGTVTHIPVGGIAVQTAVIPGLNTVFVSVYDLKEVVRYNVSTGDTTRIPLPAGSEGPIQMYPSPDGQRIYVCDQGIVNGNPSSNKLYVINTSTNTVTNTVTVGNGAHGVVTNSDGTRIFVTNLKDNSVSVVDAQSLTVIGTVPVGEKPNGISVMKCNCY